MTTPRPDAPSRPGNVLHCPRCERSYRFARHPGGQLVTVRQKRYPWSREATWQPWGVWGSTLGKFRCKCGSALTVR